MKKIIKFLNEFAVNKGFDDWEDLKGQSDGWEDTFLLEAMRKYGVKQYAKGARNIIEVIDKETSSEQKVN